MKERKREREKERKRDREREREKEREREINHYDNTKLDHCWFISKMDLNTKRMRSMQSQGANESVCL